MRNCKDAKGHLVGIHSLSAKNAYNGMIEGTPYLGRRFRLLTGRQWMKQPGTFVHGLDGLEREIASMDPKHNVWAANECWEARVVDAIDYGNWTQRVLLLRWYQQGSDPMAKFQELIASIDFVQLATTVAVDMPD